MSWQAETDEIRKRRKLATAQGGKAAIRKHHDRGKLTIRERIDLLLDKGTFKEHGRLAGGAELDEHREVLQFTPANYVVGLGKINNRTVVIGGEDFTLKGGSPNAAGLRKSVYAEHAALNTRVPLIRLLEGGGGSVETGAKDFRKPRTVGHAVYEPHRFAVIADAMAHVPVVSAAVGPVAGFPAGRLVASHFSVMVAGISQVMIGGPALVERALGQAIDKEDLGGVDVHRKSGIVDNVATDEADAFEQIRRFLSYLPSNVWEKADRTICDDPTDRSEESLLTLVPRDRRRTFNIRKAIKGVVDKESFFEFSAGYGPSLVIGLARINGQCIGVTANDCRFFAGAMTAEAAIKMRRLIELCDCFHLPVLNFVDEPGFMIGPGAESNGTIRFGMAAVSAAAKAQTPWASVLVRKNFGVASAAHFGPDSYRLNWPSAESGALPLEGGVAVAYRRKIMEADDPTSMRQQLEAKMEAERSPYLSAESFAIHDLIDPRETRSALCDWVEWIQPKLETLTGPVSFTIRP